jgi:NADH:ubiquinone oxidoreductase subunit 4 (subunit M)
MDFKRLIAYSSVAHMNYVVVGIFATNVYGVVGSVQLMLSHGVVSAALFILVGILYERHKVRLIKYYSGLVFLMPLFSVFMVIFTLANVAFPGLANFPGEFLIFVATANKNFSLALILSVGLFLTGVYSFWFLNRILFTTYNKYSTLPTQQFLDLNRREFWVLFILVIVNFLMGLFTRFFTLPVYIGLLLN